MEAGTTCGILREEGTKVTSPGTAWGLAGGQQGAQAALTARVVLAPLEVRREHTGGKAVCQAQASV